MAGQSGSAVQNNAENLLDIDFDGSAPASMQKVPGSGSTGLEGLSGTPMRVASPAVGGGASGGMEDLMGIFGGGGDAGGSNGAVGVMQPSNGASGSDDLMNGFAGMDLSGSAGQQQQQPPPLQGGKNTNEDLLGLF